MHVFKHPKYYKELRSIRNKSDQAISLRAHDGERERAPGQGLKHQASSVKPQAPEETSDKRRLQACVHLVRATSCLIPRWLSKELQALPAGIRSHKPQATSLKLQA